MNLTILEARRFIAPNATFRTRTVKDYEIDMEFTAGRIYSYNSIKDYKLSSGDVLVRKPHGIVSATGAQNSYLLTLDFSGDVEQDMYSRNKQTAFQPICDYEPVQRLESIIHPTHPNDIMSIYKKLISLSDRSSLITKELAHQLIYTLNAEILKKNYELLKPTETISECIIAYMQENLNRQITLDEISKLVHREKSYLVRLFRSETGKTPIEALVDMRLTTASDLIATSDLSVYEIATQCGYNTVSFFISKYKQRYGMTPEKHRHIIREGQGVCQP